jgi:glycosyltransferase involved in cell wall biosynthesis
VLQNNPTFHTVYPNKVFDYMACERPTLLGIDGVARRLVCDDAGAGLFAEPENADALTEAAIALGDSSQLRCQLGTQGRQWVELNASRQALAARYLELLSELSLERTC